MARSPVDEYISAFPPAIRARLRKMRGVIRKNAPGAVERMTYGIPTFTARRNLVHFAGFRNHIGFYPTPAGITAFKNDLTGYVSAKGSVQFPHDRPLPLTLIARIVRYRMKEERTRAKK